MKIIFSIRNNLALAQMCKRYFIVYAFWLKPLLKFGLTKAKKKIYSFVIYEPPIPSQTNELLCFESLGLLNTIYICSVFQKKVYDQSMGLKTAEEKSGLK